MKEKSHEDVGQLLRQARTLLVLCAFMLVASSLFDPPASTIGIVLNVLSLVVLAVVVIRLHTAGSQSNSSSSNP